MAGPDTYPVQIDGVGTLMCRRRTMRTAIAIAAEYNRLTEGADRVSPEFDGICSALSYIKGMTVEAPDGWDPYEFDPDSAEDMAKLRKVHDAIQAAEGRFRRGSGADTKAAGESA